MFRSSFTHSNSGKSREYLPVYGICDIGKYDLIWFDLIRHSKSHWKQHSVRKIFIWIHCRFASNKYFSISFPFSHFRCSCSRECHSKKVEILEKLEKTAFLSLAERRRKLKFNLFVHSQTRFHSFSFSFFNKQLPFILTHSISSNQAKAKANQDEKRRNKENEHHQQPSNKSKTPFV